MIPDGLVMAIEVAPGLVAARGGKLTHGRGRSVQYASGCYPEYECGGDGYRGEKGAATSPAQGRHRRRSGCRIWIEPGFLDNSFPDHWRGNWNDLG